MEFLEIAAGVASAMLILLVAVWGILDSRAMPPGPAGWPLIGKIFSLKQPLHMCYHNLSQKYGPIFHLKVGMRSLVVVNSTDIAKEVLKIRDVEFANRPLTRYREAYSSGFKGIVCAPFGENFKTMRRLASTHLFSKSALNANSPIRESEIHSLVQSVKKSKVVDLRDGFGELNANIVLRLLFGIKSASFTKIIQVLEEINRCGLNVNIGELFPALDWLDLNGVCRKMSRELLPKWNSIIMDIIQEREKQRSEHDERDLLDVLMTLQNDGTISLASVLCLLSDMIFAGIETSQPVMEWTMAELMNNTQIMSKVRQEIDNVVGPRRLMKGSDIEDLPYLQAIVKESLRLHPAAPLGVPHYNLKESTLAGYKIPAKSKVFINIWAIGRDPAHWKDPLIFKPERFLSLDVDIAGQNFELLPFSSGRRMCPGYPLATRSISMAIGTLIHAFDWEFIGANSLDEACDSAQCKLAHKLEARAHPRLEESVYVLS